MEITMKQTQDKWQRRDFWFSCWEWETQDVNETVYVITKLDGYGFRVGQSTEDKVEYQPHPDRDGYLGSFRTLKIAKKVIDKRVGGE